MTGSSAGRSGIEPAARHLGGLLATFALLAGTLLAGGHRDAMALLTDAEQVTATSTAASSFSATTYYLHNNPTPPIGNTNAQASLSMNTSASTATTLFNYDADQDSAAGRRIERGGSGATESTLARYQNWRGPTAGLLGQSINGTVLIEFWSAMPSFTQGTAGEVRVFLRDFNTILGTTTEIGSTTVSASDWQAGNSAWVKRSASLSVNTTLLVGHQLEVKLLVGSGSATDMLFAYDTTLYRSRVRLL